MTVYKIIKVSKDILYAIELYQVREVLEIPGKVQKILDLILDSKGEWLKDNHKFVLILEDFFGSLAKTSPAKTFCPSLIDNIESGTK